MIKQIVLTIVTLSFVACSGTKKMTKNDNVNDKATISENTKKEQIDGTKDTADNINPLADKATGGLAAQTNGSTGAAINVQTTSGSMTSSMNYDQMYADLEMTDEQISSFHSAMENFQQKQVNMPNGEMLDNIADERTNHLERILSEAQFAKYQKWESNN